MRRWQLTGILAIGAAIGLALAAPALRSRPTPAAPEPAPLAPAAPAAVPEPIATVPAAAPAIPELAEPGVRPARPPVKLPPDPPEPETHVGCGGVAVRIDQPVPACGRG